MPGKTLWTSLEFYSYASTLKSLVLILSYYFFFLSNSPSISSENVLSHQDVRKLGFTVL